MKISTVQKIKPGDTIEQKGSHQYGIIDNKSVWFGDLSKIDLQDNKKKNIYFINSKVNLFMPQKDDIVIGKITFKTADFYKIELGQSYTGFLPVLAFPNVTRRNKPELQVDDYVISRIMHPSQESVLYCDEGLGKIDGFVYNFPVWKIRKLLVTQFLHDLGKSYKFQIGFGVNGRVFIKSEDVLVAKKIINKIKDFNKNRF
ncbi:hypothetical protein EDEG_04060 [Edhazardia aedis USNM 41457]|uniref:Uncharacterized protein n=1 Tax=Edhazardia aedis (strain USNM 41457) TaxID=1003232 RepID=J9D020_EDHAE|nr:hypothetical protein EDEG_04060 [Edhazardia aedis USNM 41457]|eukprot:EJW01211.1 hypothetical protein EDEG_04060 [Edhazardia aedis USNM 41457]